MKYFGLDCDQNFGLFWEQDSCWEHYDEVCRRTGFPFWEDCIKDLTIPVDDQRGILPRELDYFNVFSSIKGPTPLPIISTKFLEAFGEKELLDAYWSIPLTYEGVPLNHIMGLHVKPDAITDDSSFDALTRPAYSALGYDFIVTEAIQSKLEGLNMPDCKWVELNRES